MGKRSMQGSSNRRLLLAAALVPLVLAGCTGERQAQQPGPRERVAGERQEDETMRLVREAGLPETFAFGGRTWRAHEVHRVDHDDMPTPGTDAATDKAPDATGAIDGFIPVADFQVNGHQIYRREGVDEAMTDNIFLRAETMPATTGAAGTAEMPETGDSATTEPGTPGETTPTAAHRTAFVEYDAASETMENVELPQILSMAGLQESITHGGKTWQAQEMQVYDADVFEDLKRLPQQISGKDAFRGDDADTVYLKSEVTMPQPATPPGAEPPTGAEHGAEHPGMAPGMAPGMETAMDPGPVFIRYEAQ